MLIFVESQRKPSELIFVILNFVTAQQPSPAVWHYTNDDGVIDFLCHQAIFAEKLLQIA
jgi:hypothetical protein